MIKQKKSKTTKEYLLDEDEHYSSEESDEDSNYKHRFAWDQTELDKI
jgi:hypothetical protein